MVTISLQVVRNYCSILSLIYQHMLFLDANTFELCILFLEPQGVDSQLGVGVFSQLQQGFVSDTDCSQVPDQTQAVTGGPGQVSQVSGGTILLKPQYPTHHNLQILLIFLMEHTVSLRHHLLSSIFFVSSHLITLHES